jgi:ribonuclease HI
MDASDPHVHIYTDGSCDTGSGEGGWGFLLVYGGHHRVASGYQRGTTNNRMELTAAVEALRALKGRCRATITTDSRYLKSAFTDGWLANWQRNGWRTASRQPVKNRDLWLELLDLTERHDVSWAWTKGHAGHAHNEQVDRLALRARKERRGLALQPAG